MATPRVRHSLQFIQQQWDSNVNPSLLSNLIRAFRGIMDLDPDDENSFFKIGSYHGEPFTPNPHPNPDPDIEGDYWGGYCHHQNVLFPAWHRAYLLRIEDALRTIVPDVTLPYWDELFTLGTDPDSSDSKPIPSILTSPIFELDGRHDNPLYAYKFQKGVGEVDAKPVQRGAKPAGYVTVRYPLSGLVGSEEDRNLTALHNTAFADNSDVYLNSNVKQWLRGTVQITKDPKFKDPKPKDPKEKRERYPDTLSVFSRFADCLEAPNYTLFSNKRSAGDYTKKELEKGNKVHVVSLEDPHNAIHLALGGYYEKGGYNADPILNANGDMGDNDTAGFDPIFFLHHCFIDYAFYHWQVKHNLTKPGSLTIDHTLEGTTSTGFADLPFGEMLTENTPLYPFKKPDGSYYTLLNTTDAENQLGYIYEPGSFDTIVHTTNPVPSSLDIVEFVKISEISRSQVLGSFVVRTFVKLPSGEKVQIGRDPILNRWSTANCANCQDKLDVVSYTPVTRELWDAIKGLGASEGVELAASEDGGLEYDVEVDSKALLLVGDPDTPMKKPKIEVLRG